MTYLPPLTVEPVYRPPRRTPDRYLCKGCGDRPFPSARALIRHIDAVRAELGQDGDTTKAKPQPPGRDVYI